MTLANGKSKVSDRPISIAHKKLNFMVKYHLLHYPEKKNQTRHIKKKGEKPFRDVEITVSFQHCVLQEISLSIIKD